MEKVLITGIDSFTGKHLARYLEDSDFDIHGTSLFHKSHKKYLCDITKTEEIKIVLKDVKPDYIIHLSAIASPAYGNHEEFYKVNTIGAINILDSLLELNQNPSKVILVSSATVYGNQNLEILDESLCPNPSNHYALSKYAMESLAKTYFDKLNIMITRPFNYTGVGQTENFLIPKIVQHFKEKKSQIELGNLEVSREFNDISFVCEVYKRLLKSDATSQIVNIASNRGVKLLDIIKLMNEIASYEIKVVVNPAFVRKGEIKSLTGSTDKLFDLVGQIEQQTLRNTLLDMYEV